MRRCQPLASAKAPWTSTIVGFPVFCAPGDWAPRVPPTRTPRTRAKSESRRKRAFLMTRAPFLCAIAPSRPLLSQGLEGRAELRDEDLRLLPRGEVTALCDLVVVDELRVGLLRPALRRLVELVRISRHGDGDRDALRGEERQLALPVETRRGDRRVREPVERDVVQDVVPGQALGLSGEDPGDELLAAQVVVEHPRGKSDRRIRQGVESLRAVRHLHRVAEAVLVEEVELVPRVL